MKNNKKGLTILELIVTFTIAAILALVVVPNLTQYIGYSAKGVCETSRIEFMRSYQTYLASGEGSQTLEQALNGEIPAMAADRSRLKCPDGGTFTVKDGSIHCSVHGAIGSASGGSGGSVTILKAGTVIFGTPETHEVVLDSWKGSCKQVTDFCAANPYQTGLTLSELSKGSVLVDEYGKTYLVLWNDPWLTKNQAVQFVDNPSAINFIKAFDPTHVISSSAYNSATGWSPHLMNGDVFYENGIAYVFMGNNDTQWESLPQQGGWWIKLV